MVCNEMYKPYDRKLSLRDLMYMGRTEVSCYRVVGTNNYIALTNQWGRCADGYDMINIIEERKTPLYKQAMAMQMGRMPQLTTKTHKTFRIQQVERQNNVMYDFYIVR